MPDPAMAISLKAATASAPCQRSAALCPRVIDRLLTTMPCAQRICATLIHPQHQEFHRSQPHNRHFTSAREPAGLVLASSGPPIQAPISSTRRFRAQLPRAITSNASSPTISSTTRRPNARACWPVVSPPQSASPATPASSSVPRGHGRAQHGRPHFGSSPSRLFHGLGGACASQFAVSPRTSPLNPCAWRAVAVRASADLRVTPGAATAPANPLASSGAAAPAAAAPAAATATAATNGAVAPSAASRHSGASADASVREKVLDGEGREYPYLQQQQQLQEPRFHRRTGGEAFVALESSPMVEEAWELLQASTVYYCNQPVGTVAASDPTDTSPLNYDQVFIRDFIPSAVAFLLSGQPEIVRNFLLYTLQLQSWEKTVDCHRPGEGLMPASFKVTQVPMDNGAFEEHLDPDFGESAIGRVAPVDSGLWWIQLLRAYGKCTGDVSLQQRVDVQTGMKLILKICLADHFDMFPTLITTDGSCMIDRRLGIHGHPLEIQSLLYGALRAAREMLSPENGGADLLRAVDARLTAMSFHVRRYYWLDLPKLNEIYRYKTEEYSSEAVNKFNIYPDQIPAWLMDWIPDRGGYLVGNVQPAHMDFRFFCLGNMWAVVSSLAAPAQAEVVLDLVEERWDDLVGAMPLKIAFPALEGEEWRIITGSDPKNTPWSYHNGGSWPVLLWQFTAACIKMGRPHLAERAVALVEKRLQKDRWPEYYDTRSGRFIGKQARLHQTWSIAGYLASKLLLANPDAVWLFATEEDQGILDAASSFLGTGQRRRRTYPLASPLL